MVAYRREYGDAQPVGYAKEEDVKEECATLSHVKVNIILIYNHFHIAQLISSK